LGLIDACAALSGLDWVFGVLLLGRRPFLRMSSRFFLGMPAPSVRTRSARLQPTRLRAVEEGRALLVASVLAPRDYRFLFHSHLCFDSPSTPSGDLRDRLAQTFFLGCIAWWRPSNWLHGGSRRSPRSRPLDTGLGAPLGALRANCGRWLNRDGVDDFVAAHSFRCR